MAAHNKLSDWLRAENISQAEMARRCEYDRSNFHRLLSGKLFPSLSLATRIERETHGAVPAVSWADPDTPHDTTHAGRYPAGALAFPHRHLLAIGQLETHEILYLLDEAEQWVTLNRQAQKHSDTLAGLTIINAFFENSTRTLLSFEIAGKRLGADVVNMHAAQSSVKKGETLIDTAVTLNAMRPDVIVIRHDSSGATGLIADKVDCPVLNAGDGRHEHPTQALLDALTIRRRVGRINGTVVVICGDVLHSRVARSNIILLGTLGAEVRVVAPPTLLPSAIERMGARHHHTAPADVCIDARNRIVTTPCYMNDVGPWIVFQGAERMVEEVLRMTGDTASLIRGQMAILPQERPLPNVPPPTPQPPPAQPPTS